MFIGMVGSIFVTFAISYLEDSFWLLKSESVLIKDSFVNWAHIRKLSFCGFQREDQATCTI